MDINLRSTEAGAKAEKSKKNEVTDDNGHAMSKHPTSYFETLTNLLKGNVGAGLFAMGDAFKNAGLVVGPVLTLFLAVICIHCQHLLVYSSRKVKKLGKIDVFLDYPETVQKCFELGPPKLRPWANVIRLITQILICITQLGFCCIYFVFITDNIEQILHYHGLLWETRWIMALTFIPILLPSLITNLKYIAKISFLANVCLTTGITITMYFAFAEGLPDPTERNYSTNLPQLALFFGTVLFSFEGIALVLPLRNSMKIPETFSGTLGVLNVGMSIVGALYVFTGFFGYLKWGEGVDGSMTLNLGSSSLAQFVKIAASLGVFFGYPLQFYVPIKIMWPTVQERFSCYKNPVIGEIVFRSLIVLLTFLIAESVPKLGLFISLIGAFCSTALALILPALMELIIRSEGGKGPGVPIFAKDIIIIVLGFLGTLMGTYQSIYEIVLEFSS